MARFGQNIYQAGRHVGVAQKMRKEAEKAREQLRGPISPASQSTAFSFQRAPEQRQQPTTLQPVNTSAPSPVLGGGAPAQGSMQAPQTGGEMQAQFGATANAGPAPIFGGGQIQQQGQQGAALGGLGAFQLGGDYVPPPSVQNVQLSSVGQLTGTPAGAMPVGGGNAMVAADPLTAAIMETVASGEFTSTPDPYSSLESGVNDALKKLLMGLEGGPDSSEEEALIRELNAQRLGQAGVDMAAGFGGSGFGGGAMAAAQGDLQNQFAMTEAQQLLGARSDARADYMDRLRTAVGLSQGERGLDIQERSEETNAGILDKVLELLGEDPEAEPGGDFAGTPASPGYDPGQAAMVGGTLNALNEVMPNVEMLSNPAELPDGARYDRTTSGYFGTYWIYKDAQGREYHIFADPNVVASFGGDTDAAGASFNPGDDEDEGE